MISRGHSYAIKTGDDLSKALEETEFRIEPEAEATTYERLNVVSNEEATAILYLLPDEATKRFVRVSMDAVTPIDSEDEAGK
jgi:hypothetical protein